MTQRDAPLSTSPAEIRAKTGLKQFPKSGNRFSDKNCAETQELEYSAAPKAQAKNTLGPVGRALFWLGTRVAHSLLVLFAVTLVVFFLLNAMPDDPAQIILGEFARPEAVAYLRAELGLDRPLALQYFDWFWRLLHADLGTSFGAQSPVIDLVWPALRNSLIMVGVSGVLAVPIAIIIGVVTALWRNSPFDHAADYILLGLSSLPEFAKGIFLVLLLSIGLFTILPATSMIPPGASPLFYPRDLAMPVLVMVLSALPYLSRLVRSSMIDALDSEYVQMAQLKGLSQARILFFHALPNTAAPVIQGAALSIALMFGGSVIVENLLRYPGIGILMTDAITSRDQPLIQGVILAFASCYMLINLVADVLIVGSNPKLWGD